MDDHDDPTRWWSVELRTSGGRTLDADALFDLMDRLEHAGGDALVATGGMGHPVTVTMSVEADTAQDAVAAGTTVWTTAGIEPHTIIGASALRHDILANDIDHPETTGTTNP